MGNYNVRAREEAALRQNEAAQARHHAMGLECAAIDAYGRLTVVNDVIHEMGMDSNDAAQADRLMGVSNILDDVLALLNKAINNA